MAEPKEIPPQPASPEGVWPTPDQQRLLWTAVTALAVTTLVGVAGLVFWGFVSLLGWSYPVLLPIGLAVIIALVLEPMVDFLQRRGVRRRTGTLATCLFAAVLFLLFWIFLLPPLVTETGRFLTSLPGLISEGVDRLENLSFDATLPPAPTVSPPGTPPATNAAGSPLVRIATNIVATTNAPPAPATSRRHAVKPPPSPRVIISHSAMQDWVKANLPVVQATVENNIAHVVYTAVGPVGQALGFLLGFGFVPIYVYYFLVDQESITKHWHEYVPLRRSPLRKEVVSVLTEINEVLVKYFRGQIIVAGCNGLLTCVGLTLIGIPYGLILGILTGALSIVPFLGIIASILPALLLGFISGGDWVKPALVLVVFAVVQLSESMFITPRVQSHSTGLHPLTIIVGILFWSLLLPGLLGPVVAVPLTCAAVVLMRRYVWDKRLSRPGIAAAKA